MVAMSVIIAFFVPFRRSSSILIGQRPCQGLRGLRGLTAKTVVGKIHLLERRQASEAVWDGTCSRVTGDALETVSSAIDRWHLPSLCLRSGTHQDYLRNLPQGTDVLRNWLATLTSPRVHQPRDGVISPCLVRSDDWGSGTVDRQSSRYSHPQYPRPCSLCLDCQASSGYAKT